MNTLHRVFAIPRRNTSERTKGSFYLNADFHSASPVFTEEQKRHILDGEDENLTVLRCRITAENKSAYPTYAYFRFPHINTRVMAEFEEVDQSFQGGCGYYKDGVYAVCNVNGNARITSSARCCYNPTRNAK